MWSKDYGFSHDSVIHLSITESSRESVHQSLWRSRHGHIAQVLGETST